MLSANGLRAWATQYKIADSAILHVKSHHKKVIDEYLIDIAKKGQAIREELLAIEVVYISLWVPYVNDDQENYVVASVKVDYVNSPEKEDNNAGGEKNKLVDHIGICRVFFTLQGTVEHDEFEAY